MADLSSATQRKFDAKPLQVILSNQSGRPDAGNIFEKELAVPDHEAGWFVATARWRGEPVDRKGDQ